MSKEICEVCQRPIAGESQWRAMSGWEGYSPINEAEWCLYPDQCKDAKAARNATNAKLDELKAVKAVLRNHNLCKPDCTPAKHIEAVYADLQSASNRMRALLSALKTIRLRTDVEPGTMMPVGEIWRIANDVIEEKE